MFGTQGSTQCFRELSKPWAPSRKFADEPPGCRLIVREQKIAAETAVADSISVNGCCLTVVEWPGRHLRLPSRPGNPRPHQSRRFEARRPGEPGAGAGRRRSAGRTFRQRAYRRRGHAYRARAITANGPPSGSSAPRIPRAMASKGSIAVDGVSLTIVESEPDRFSVALIPYTLAVTTLGLLAVGGKSTSKPTFSPSTCNAWPSRTVG